MINFLGFLIIICGFLAPFISGGMMPSAFFFGVATFFFFWIGFLLLFLPIKYYPKASGWLKWARMGLLLNVVWTFFVIILHELVTNTSTYLVYILLRGAGWILRPISGIFEILFPFNQVKMPDGSIIIGITSSFDTLTHFFDISVYIGIGIAVGKLISKKHL